MALQLDRLLETAVSQNATETWLVPGMPPLFRINGVFREAMIPPLTMEDVEGILSAKDESVRAQYNARNIADFPLTYGNNYARFEVTIVKTSADPLAMLRLTHRLAPQ